METKINITSGVMEKVAEGAKEFVNKLIIPSIEETGLLLKDQVAFWRYNNQIKMLLKTQEICKKNNINPKTISLKLLCPLLEYASLEEDEVLQDKWASLLSNMVDSKQNIDNHVFPYILSQISKKEFLLLESVYNKKNYSNKLIKDCLERQQLENLPKIEMLTKEIAELDEIIEKEKVGNPYYYHSPSSSKKWEKERLKNQLETQLKDLEQALGSPVLFSDNDLQPYEERNLIRLGLIREVPQSRAIIDNQSIEIPYESDDNEVSLDDVEISIETVSLTYLTELGELFMNACKKRI